MPEFRVVPDGPRSFAVQVQFSRARIQVVRGFSTEAEAQVWVAAQQTHDAEGERSSR